MKKIFCCPALEHFDWLTLWTTVRLHEKKLQNATKAISSLGVRSPWLIDITQVAGIFSPGTRLKKRKMS